MWTESSLSHWSSREVPALSLIGMWRAKFGTFQYVILSKFSVAICFIWGLVWGICFLISKRVIIIIVQNVLFEIDNICDCTVEYLNKVKGSTDVAIITKSSAVFS